MSSQKDAKKKDNEDEKAKGKGPEKSDGDKSKDDVKKEEEKKVEIKLTPAEQFEKDFEGSVETLMKGVTLKDKQLMSRAVRGVNGIRRRIAVSPTFFTHMLHLYLPEAIPVFQPIEAKLMKELEAKEKVEKEKADKEQAEKEKADKEKADKEKAKKGKDSKDKGKDKDKSNKMEVDSTGDAKQKEAQEKAKKDQEKKEKDALDKAKRREKEREEKKNQEVLPEVSIYFKLLVLLCVMDNCPKEQALARVRELFASLQTFNRRTLDLLSAKVYFYFALINEQNDRLASIRNELLAAHRTACLQHNEPGQASLTNCILRNFLHFKLYAQADKFRLNTTFPESRSNHQHARYLYYIGNINSVQLHYSEALNNLNNAIRKAPQRTAVGFRQIAHKLLVIVQLLMGEIPERSLFRQADLKQSLRPYYQITQAVRVGDLEAFMEVMRKFKAVFLQDRIYSLIVRLRHNVIKTGLRKINLSYSRISIKDICQKLHFDNEEDAEYIVAKAICDGVIDAVLDRKHHFLFSKENIDIYSTQEPQAAFHKRIQFCNEIHNGAVKALRFPPNAYKAVELPEELDEEADKDKEVDEVDSDHEHDKPKDGDKK